jgi:hypothetical protein
LERQDENIGSDIIKSKDVKMLLYHASLEIVEVPRIYNRYKTLDFGTGFYTTANESQAKEFAIKAYLRRGRNGAPVVNVYEYEDSRAANELNIRTFVEPNPEWLEFVAHNRRHGRVDNNSDIIIGPVANDDVFEVITLYETGQLDQKTAIERFKVKHLFNQTLFCSDKSIFYLSYKTSYTMEAPK